MSNVIAFPGQRSAAAPLTETHYNLRLRQGRRDEWRDAHRLAYYWRARLDWASALELAQQYRIADSGTFKLEDRLRLLEKWREAFVRKLLTPAPDLAAVAWKRAKLESRDFLYLPIEREAVEQTIADDVAFLEAHSIRAKRRL